MTDNVLGPASAATDVPDLFTALSGELNRKSAPTREFSSNGGVTMAHPDVVIVLTTWPASEDAGPTAATLVEERLAACVNLLPEMESTYRWKNAVEQERERQMIIKTTRPRVDALMARLKQLHPNDVPEALVVPVVGGSEAYLAWVGECTRG
jgi:periplasmic divalent cation tolerance protein